jgi:hypothetical protein
VNVLTIEGRHERPVDPVYGIVREVISFVLERLYLSDVLVELLWILEQLVEQGCGSGHPARNLREQVVELVVTRD